MSDIAIKLDKLSKVYRLYDDPVDRLKESLHPFRKQYHSDFYALKDVNFDVRKGETVGIVGRNGSGKSTLLKLITGVLTPSSGSVTVSGKVSALLELGAGFNPELTGIENVYFNGIITGYSRNEIESKMEDILAFADIGEFVHQPVKTYSSGMYVRLAFAVAINVDPDILIVDEALAVGDEAFQRKCYSRINSFQDQGKTILFVSHSAGTILELCSKALFFDHGELIMEGSPKAIVTLYHKLLYASKDELHSIREEIKASKHNTGTGTIDGESMDNGNNESESYPFYDPNLVPQSTIVYECRGAEIKNPRIMTPDGKVVNILKRGMKYVCAYDVNFIEEAVSPRFGMAIKTVSGFELGGRTKIIDDVGPRTKASIKFFFECALLPGVYFINSGIMGKVEGEYVFMNRIIDALMFKVLPETENPFFGIIDFFSESEPIVELGEMRGHK